MKEADGIYEEYADSVYKYLYRLSGSAEVSEELTQETFYQAVRTIGRYRGDCAMLTWLCQIAKNSWYKLIDKKSKARHVPIEGLENELRGDDSPETILVNEATRMEVYGNIHALKEPYREVALLRALGDLSFSQIGQIMGKTENWARVTFFRAKLTLMERGKENGN
ncbi:RNA polymerase subunit sigma [Clostridia bacterium]|nr:RNA polymerase subunit sigma [Clostridia bacterium]